jgi:hypothetical protein
MWLGAGLSELSVQHSKATDVNLPYPSSNTWLGAGLSELSVGNNINRKTCPNMIHIMSFLSNTFTELAL